MEQPIQLPYPRQRDHRQFSILVNQILNRILGKRENAVYNAERTVNL